MNEHEQKKEERANCVFKQRIVYTVFAMVIGMLALYFLPGPHHDPDSPKYHNYGNHQTHQKEAS